MRSPTASPRNGAFRVLRSPSSVAELPAVRRGLKPPAERSPLLAVLAVLAVNELDTTLSFQGYWHRISPKHSRAGHDIA